MGDKDRKREYINAVYRILQKDGLQSLTIRKVADAVGVSSAALYKHFDSLEQLAAYASVRYLSDYAQDVQTLAKVDLNPMQLNIQLWESLAYYSFRDAPIFENLFFGENHGTMQEVIFDFYQLFPEEVVGMKAYVMTMMENSNLFDRDFYILIRAADEGMIPADKVNYLVNLEVYLFEGMLAAYRNTYNIDENYRKATRTFMDLLVKTYNAFLLPGYSILTVSPLKNPRYKPNSDLDPWKLEDDMKEIE